MISYLSAFGKLPVKERRKFVLNFQSQFLEHNIWNRSLRLTFYGMEYFFQHHCAYTNNFLLVFCYLHLLPDRKMLSEYQPFRHQSWNTALESMNLCCFRLKGFCPTVQRKQLIHSSVCGLALGSVEPSQTTECYFKMVLVYLGKDYTGFFTLTPFNDSDSVFSEFKVYLTMK